MNVMIVLVDSALRSAAVVLIAWLFAVLLRGASADLRRRLWLAVVCAIALMPVAQRLMPAALSSTFVVPASASLHADVAFSAPFRVASWMTIVWLAGLVLVLARLAAGLVAVARVTQHATARDGARYSSAINTPMTWGVLRPVVLLPAYTMDWTESRRSPLVRHEQAHIDRHDWLWQMLAQVVCAALWFNPLVWLAARELRRECERAADDRVLSSGADAPAYAAQLIEIARTIQRPSSLMSGGLAMAARGALERRVRDILDPGRSHMSTSRILHAAVISAVVIVGVPLAALQSGQAYHPGEQGVTSPVPLDKPKPGYTEEALRARIEGIVRVSLVVSEEGLPENIRVVQSLDEGLDQKAVEACAGWRFKPGTRDGKPVPVAVSIDMQFTLK
jgi:TonB family protein